MNLRFDTDQGEATLAVLRQSCSNIQTELSRVQASVENLVPGAWESPAANVFSARFYAWIGAMHNNLEQLEMMNNTLRYEIEQWIETAARFQA